MFPLHVTVLHEEESRVSLVDIMGHFEPDLTIWLAQFPWVSLMVGTQTHPFSGHFSVRASRFFSLPVAASSYSSQVDGAGPE